MERPYGSVCRVSRAARLSAHDWAEVALSALRERGPSAVAVEPLARALGATKGSFYWHYRTREALLEAALSRWEEQETDAVMAAAERAGTPMSKLHRLFEVILVQAGRHPGHLGLHAAMDEPVVTRAVERVSGRRVDYVRALLVEGGVPADEASRRAHLLFATVLGLEGLAAALPGRLPTDDDREAWVRSAVAMAFSSGPRAG